MLLSLFCSSCSKCVILTQYVVFNAPFAVVLPCPFDSYILAYLLSMLQICCDAVIATVPAILQKFTKRCDHWNFNVYRHRQKSKSIFLRNFQSLQRSN